jgi:hypothetical protein
MPDVALKTELVPNIKIGISIGNTIVDSKRLLPLILNVRDAATPPMSEIVNVPKIRLIMSTRDVFRSDVRR